MAAAQRSLVLNDGDDGQPASAMLIIPDVSARHEAENRFEQSFNTNPAPALICRLRDLRFVKVNQGFLDMNGHQRDPVLCRTGYDIDVLSSPHSAGSAAPRRRHR